MRDFQSSDNERDITITLKVGLEDGGFESLGKKNIVQGSISPKANING
jgi:hypothetical protein